MVDLVALRVAVRLIGFARLRDVVAFRVFGVFAEDCLFLAAVLAIFAKCLRAMKKAYGDARNEEQLAGLKWLKTIQRPGVPGVIASRMS